MRLLIAGQDDFLAETHEVLRAGLQTAPWVTVDDTGARHRGASGVCTQIGDHRFTWFGTTSAGDSHVQHIPRRHPRIQRLRVAARGDVSACTTLHERSGLSSADTE